MSSICRLYSYGPVYDTDNMPRKTPVRFGIIGYGKSSRVFHLPYITRNPDIEVVAFLQRSEPTPGTPHCTTDYPKAVWHKTIEDFCADRNIDVGVILTRQDTHAELGIKVLESGKHGNPLCLSSCVGTLRFFRSGYREADHHHSRRCRQLTQGSQEGWQAVHSFPEWVQSPPLLRRMTIG